MYAPQASENRPSARHYCTEYRYLSTSPRTVPQWFIWSKTKKQCAYFPRMASWLRRKQNTSIWFWVSSKATGPERLPRYQGQYFDKDWRTPKSPSSFLLHLTTQSTPKLPNVGSRQTRWCWCWCWSKSYCTYLTVAQTAAILVSSKMMSRIYSAPVQ